ncbi:MAG: protein tyrosine phosphatase [Anaerovibrio sp.]|uniref:phosphatase domain-containing putative toxin n=1 Tax=Anaerovibrio sp. TaxID=1872532 RepID=UPI0025FC20AD|nr:protein tyrosine phosphatase [Anaerovibrio sp.]MCR5177053.1 protein tyrosine phosphatase [Anaerovibrio sp.]
MKHFTSWLSVALTAVLMLYCSLTMAAEPVNGQFLKFDRIYGVSNMPNEYRAASEEKFKRAKDDIYPSAYGLKDLRVSGSSFFSKNEFEALLQKIPAERKAIIVLDLRNESHGYINGHGVSWYSRYKTFNKGLSADQVDERECALLADVKQKGYADIAVQAKNKDIVFTVPIQVESVMTEKEYLESLGIRYFRIPIMDYTAPTNANIDRFVEFYKTLPANSWIHAHCEAGVGRTTIALSMIDMLHNAGKLSYDEIMTRQVLMGGQDVRKSAKKATDTYKTENYPKRAEFTRRFYDYAKEHPDLSISWSQWCKEKGYVE